MLTFNALRMANRLRLPQFKNSKGELAHKKPDGSDWSPAQWFQAMVGEVGEFASVRAAYERGEITWNEMFHRAKKELPDIQIYLDLLSQRALDVTDKIGANQPRDDAQIFMSIMSALGEYANARKKYDRGDIDKEQFRVLRDSWLSIAEKELHTLWYTFSDRRKNEVVTTHGGVALGEATIDKFNEVSVRVGSSIRLTGPAALDISKEEV